MEEPGVKLAVLEAQYKEIKETLAEIKSAVTDLVKIKSEVSAQGMVQKAHEEKIEALHKRAENHEKTIGANAGFVSRLQGAFKLTGVLIGILQAILLTGGGWVLNNLISTKEEVQVLKQNIRYLERQHPAISAPKVEYGK